MPAVGVGAGEAPAASIVESNKEGKKMGFRARKKIPGKTPGELDAMQAAGEIVGKALCARPPSRA